MGAGSPRHSSDKQVGCSSNDGGNAEWPSWGGKSLKPGNKIKVFVMKKCLRMIKCERWVIIFFTCACVCLICTFQTFAPLNLVCIQRRKISCRVKNFFH